MTTPKNPPRIKINREISIAPGVVSVPNIPFIGEIKISQIPCGCESTVWYVPDKILPASSISYTPAGMIQVKIAIKTIIRNKTVNDDGIENFFLVFLLFSKIISSSMLIK